MRVSLHVAHGEVHVALLAGDEVAAVALDARRQDVRDALSDAGLSLDSWDVRSDGGQEREGRPGTRPQPAARGAAVRHHGRSPSRPSSGLFL